MRIGRMFPIRPSSGFASCYHCSKINLIVHRLIQNRLRWILKTLEKYRTLGSQYYTVQTAKHKKLEMRDDNDNRRLSSAMHRDCNNCRIGELLPNRINQGQEKLPLISSISRRILGAMANAVAWIPWPLKIHSWRYSLEAVAKNICGWRWSVGFSADVVV